MFGQHGSGGKVEKGWPGSVNTKLNQKHPGTNSDPNDTGNEYDWGLNRGFRPQKEDMSKYATDEGEPFWAKYFRAKDPAKGQAFKVPQIFDYAHLQKLVRMSDKEKLIESHMGVDVTVK